jgi:DNA-binding transcriptional LysR family regulator
MEVRTSELRNMQLCNFNIKIEDAVSFVAAVRHQSISRAAAALGLNQPSVTRRIQSLEGELGVVLLDRNTRPLKPTAIGLRVFEKCRDIVKDAQALKALVEAEATPSGSVHIGMSQRVAELGLGQMLQDFQDRYPDLNVRATTRWSAELLEMVQYNELHAAILQSPASTRFPEGVSAQALMPVEIVVVAAKGRFPRKKLSLADCSPGPWILNPEGCTFRRRLFSALEDKGLPVKVAMDGFGTELQMQLIARGLGLGLLPLPCIESSAYRHQVEILKVADFNINSMLWLIRNLNLGNLTHVIEACGQSIISTLTMLVSNETAESGVAFLRGGPSHSDRNAEFLSAVSAD